MRLDKADTVICFQLGRVICIMSYLMRVITNINKVRPDMPDGCPEKLDFEFVKYIWRFLKTSGKRNIEKLKEIKDKKIIIFKKRRQANKYIKDIAIKIKNTEVVGKYSRN